VLRLAARIVIAIASAAVLLAVGTAVSQAAGKKQPPVVCPPYGPCVVVAQQPGSGGSNGSPTQTEPVSVTTAATCIYPPGSTNVEPCFDPAFGWLNTENGCRYLALPPPGPDGQIAAEAGGYHPPGDGTYYMQSCMGIVGPPPGAVGLVQLVVWLQAPPAGYGGARPDPAILAQEAVSKLGLSGPNVKLSPPAGSQQVVGLPTWMWTTVSDATWTPHSATAAVAGESVTATATATSIDWSMGDGNSVTCDGPGTPYSSSYGAHASSPTCGYTYSSPSSTAAGGTFPVTGTTTWRITWAGGGQNGTLTLRRSTTVNVVVQEAEAVNS
jgi:hypothetical protein